MLTVYNITHMHSLKGLYHAVPDKEKGEKWEYRHKLGICKNTYDVHNDVLNWKISIEITDFNELG